MLSEEEIIRNADVFIEEKKTIRQVAKLLSISKSSLFSRLTSLLPNIDEKRYKKVRKILDKNKSERHIRGGESTRRFYLNRK